MLINAATRAMLIVGGLLAGGCGGSSIPIDPTAPSPPFTAAASPPAAGGWIYGNGYTRWRVALFGVVSELTSAGVSPIAGVMVYCDQCGEFGHTTLYTDANGRYSFSGDLTAGGGVWLRGDTAVSLAVSKDGYGDPPEVARAGWRDLKLTGDTQFDITLVRR